MAAPDAPLDEADRSRLYGTGDDNPLQPLLRAAESGDTAAMVKLGALTHDAGERAESRRWFERAAADGDAQAMFALAGMCLAEDDEQAAMGWLAAASDQGHSGAMVNLGAFAAAAGDLELAADRW